MTGNLPGTTLPLPEGQQDALFTVLDPIFAVSPGGLLLSQVTELTGLGAATIQNWVKRGWVSNPVSKRRAACGAHPADQPAAAGHEARKHCGAAAVRQRQRG